MKYDSSIHNINVCVYSSILLKYAKLVGFFAVCFFNKKIVGSFEKKLTQRNVQEKNECSEPLIQVFRVLVLPLFVCQKNVFGMHVLLLYLLV